MRYIRRGGKKAKQVRFGLVMTFYRLLFFRCDHLSNQSFSKHDCSRYSYSRCGCQTWRSCSPDVTVFQTWLFSRRSCSLDVAVLQTQLFSRHSCSPDMVFVVALHVAILQTWLFSRRSCSLDMVLLFGAAKRTSYFGPIGHLIILQTWLSSRHNQDPLTIVS